MKLKSKCLGHNDRKILVTKWLFEHLVLFQFSLEIFGINLFSKWFFLGIAHQLSSLQAQRYIYLLTFV